MSVESFVITFYRKKKSGSQTNSLLGAVRKLQFCSNSASIIRSDNSYKTHTPVYLRVCCVFTCVCACGLGRSLVSSLRIRSIMYENNIMVKYLNCKMWKLAFLCLIFRHLTSTQLQCDGNIKLYGKIENG